MAPNLAVPADAASVRLRYAFVQRSAPLSSKAVRRPFNERRIDLSTIMNMDTVNQLVDAARGVCGGFSLRRDFSAGTVGAAILTGTGHIYTGICIDLACGLGFCAETAAIAEMLKARETHIVAVAAMAGGVLCVPCGRCRETIAQLDVRNLDCIVISGEGEEVKLRSLLPRHWLSEQS